LPICSAAAEEHTFAPMHLYYLVELVAIDIIFIVRRYIFEEENPGRR
jgi:hypothetical protein